MFMYRVALYALACLFTFFMGLGIGSIKSPNIPQAFDCGMRYATSPYTGDPMPDSCRWFLSVYENPR